MSVVIRVSYESLEELATIRKVLAPLELIQDNSRHTEGRRFRRTYFKSKELCKNAQGTPNPGRA